MRVLCNYHCLLNLFPVQIVQYKDIYIYIVTKVNLGWEIEIDLPRITFIFV